MEAQISANAWAPGGRQKSVQPLYLPALGWPDSHLEQTFLLQQAKIELWYQILAFYEIAGMIDLGACPLVFENSKQPVPGFRAAKDSSVHSSEVT